MPTDGWTDSHWTPGHDISPLTFSLWRYKCERTTDRKGDSSIPTNIVFRVIVWNVHVWMIIKMAMDCSPEFLRGSYPFFFLRHWNFEFKIMIFQSNFKKVTCKSYFKISQTPTIITRAMTLMRIRILLINWAISRTIFFFKQSSCLIVAKNNITALGTNEWMVF